MSLIQDALKRQQEEMNKKAGAPGAENPLAKLQTPIPPPSGIQSKIPLRMMGQPINAPKPVIPPAIPTAPPAPAVPPPPSIPVTPVASAATPPPATAAPPALPREKPLFSKPAETATTASKARYAEPPRQKSALPSVLLAVFLLALLAIGVYFFIGRPLLTSRNLAKTLSQPVETAPLPAAVPPPEANAAVPAASNTAPESAPAAPAVAVATVTDTNIPAPAPMPELIALPEKVPEPEPPPPSLATAVMKKRSAPVAEPVDWPPVKMTGMVKLGTESAALINGKVVAAGETIENVLLLNVTKDGALLSYKGEERLLRVGETAR